ncbi:hypothetical protein IGK80_001129 [Enterococcus sp. DIV0609]|uniref:phage tail tip lysozyme n=1 Tax=unclassified Enterococcus TaxID=2608891 RepID=UPI003F297859
MIKKLLCLLVLVFSFLFLIVLGSSSVSENQRAIDCEVISDVQVVAVNKDMTENAKQIYSNLKKAFPQLTAQAMAGILGNFQQESGIMPTAVERPNDPLSGHGIAQWTAGRTTNLKNFAKEKGKEWSDLGLQIEFLIYELNGSEKASQSVFTLTSVEQATEEWQIKFERAGIPAMGNRLNYANHWYSVLGTSDPISESALSVGSSTGSEEECEEEISNNNDILGVAKSWLGWFHYPNPIAHSIDMIGGDPLNPDKEGYTDCSGYVWLVLNKAGYKVPPAMGWYTGSMTSDAREAQQYLREISPNEAQAGDIVIVNLGGGAGANGHTGILTENWKGKETKIIQEGGGQDRVSIETFGNSFGALLNGGDICLARPIKK